jgi:hypothetical protein
MVLALLAGCGSPDPAAPTGPAGTPTVAKTGNGISPTPDPEASGALVTFQRQGGLAGVNDRLVIQPDGQYVITNRDGARKQGTLNAAELAAVRAALEGFASIPSDNAGSGVMDGYDYQIRSGARTVNATDGDLPPALSRLIGELNQLLSRYGG